ncbi:MAG: hypothetical protein K2W96_03425 [Gemmataceae bacterium]|nr:hypothetical protein [Gemmataceae bacterium]
MRRVIASCLILTVVVFLTGLAASAESAEGYLSPGKAGPEFKAKIQFEAGETGTDAGREKWTIGKDGEWAYTPKGGKKPTRTGTLDAEQRKALAVHFTAMRFNALPDRLGLPAEDLVADEKRHFMFLSFGEKRTVLIGKRRDFADVATHFKPAKGDTAPPPAEETLGQDWSRFVALASVLKDMTKEGKAVPDEKDRK